jgi:hypothetical protein
MSISVNTDPELLAELIAELHTMTAVSLEELLGKLDLMRRRIIDRS